jgi:hypothetical protein
MVEYKIPQDAQWGDIDIMERSLDFTGEALLGRRQGRVMWDCSIEEGRAASPH